MKTATIKAVVLTCILAIAAGISPAFAQTITPGSSKVQALPVFQHAPMKRAPGPAALVSGVSAVKSYNWGGYAVTGTGFTNVKGSWIVPTVDCAKSSNAWAALWVGIDGFSDSTVEQTGTSSYCNRTTAEYIAWYEFYPAGSVVISSLPVSPGNKISAEVSYSGGKFTVAIIDESTGKSFSTTGTVSSAQRTSAEWITEAPSAVTGILNLADFTSSSFGDDYTQVKDTSSASDSTVTGAISAFGSKVNNITQVDWLAETQSRSSVLSSDGTSFKVTWVQYN
jgi:hypothetical protein